MLLLSYCPQGRDVIFGLNEMNQKSVYQWNLSVLSAFQQGGEENLLSLKRDFKSVHNIRDHWLAMKICSACNYIVKCELKIMKRKAESVLSVSFRVFLSFSHFMI